MLVMNMYIDLLLANANFIPVTRNNARDHHIVNRLSHCHKSYEMLYDNDFYCRSLYASASENKYYETMNKNQHNCVNNFVTNVLRSKFNKSFFSDNIDNVFVLVGKKNFKSSNEQNDELMDNVLPLALVDDMNKFGFCILGFITYTKDDFNGYDNYCIQWIESYLYGYGIGIEMIRRFNKYIDGNCFPTNHLVDYWKQYIDDHEWLNTLSNTINEYNIKAHIFERYLPPLINYNNVDDTDSIIGNEFSDQYINPIKIGNKLFEFNYLTRYFPYFASFRNNNFSFQSEDYIHINNNVVKDSLFNKMCSEKKHMLKSYTNHHRIHSIDI